MSHGIVMDYDLSTSIPCHSIPSHSITTHKSNRMLIEIVRLATLCRKGKNVSQSGRQAIRKNQMPSHDNFIEFNYNFHTWVWDVQILSWATGFRMADTYICMSHANASGHISWFYGRVWWPEPAKDEWCEVPSSDAHSHSEGSSKTHRNLWTTS